MFSQEIVLLRLSLKGKLLAGIIAVPTRDLFSLGCLFRGLLADFVVVAVP
jgi:hypothetical protein